VGERFGSWMSYGEKKEELGRWFKKTEYLVIKNEQ
jgi:hypothetical protein